MALICLPLDSLVLFEARYFGIPPPDLSSVESFGLVISRGREDISRRGGGSTGGMFSIVNAARVLSPTTLPCLPARLVNPIFPACNVGGTCVPCVCYLLLRVCVQRSAIDSCSNYVRCNLLKLLTIVTESGPSGFETVTNALDHVKVRKPAGAAIESCLTRDGGGGGGGIGCAPVHPEHIVFGEQESCMM